MPRGKKNGRKSNLKKGGNLKPRSTKSKLPKVSVPKRKRYIEFDD